MYFHFATSRQRKQSVNHYKKYLIRKTSFMWLVDVWVDFIGVIMKKRSSPNAVGLNITFIIISQTLEGNVKTMIHINMYSTCKTPDRSSHSYWTVTTEMFFSSNLLSANYIMNILNVKLHSWSEGGATVSKRWSQRMKVHSDHEAADWIKIPEDTRIIHLGALPLI